MSVEIAMSSPLQWPVHVARATEHRQSKFRRAGSRYISGRTIAEARDLVLLEMERFGGEHILVTTNVPINADGWTLTSNRRTPDDRGVAVYFNLPSGGDDDHDDGYRQAIAVDVYDKVGCNLWAVGRTIEAFRQIERDGGPSVMRAAVSGFRQIAAMSGGVSWWDVLELGANADEAEIRAAYKRLAKIRHPDAPDGSDDVFITLQEAMRQGLDARRHE